MLSAETVFVFKLRVARGTGASGTSSRYLRAEIAREQL